MSVQPKAGYKQGYRNCMHSLDNSFSSTYQPQAQNPTNAHNPSCLETPFDKYQIGSGPTNEPSVDNIIDTEAWISE